MLLVCPHCAASYRMVSENFGEQARSVRCVQCHHVWEAQPHEFDAALSRLADEIEACQSEVAIEPADFAPDSFVPPSFAPCDSSPAAITELDHSSSIVPGFHAANGARIPPQRKPARKGESRFRLGSSVLTPALICVLILTLAGLVFARARVVQVMPQTASLYAALGMKVNLRALQFDNIRTAHETKDGQPVLVVQGDIVGTAARLTQVPRLRFALLDRGGREIYAWTADPERSLLPPGETLPFRVRLASPPAEASNVTVRFFNRQDARNGVL